MAASSSEAYGITAAVVALVLLTAGCSGGGDASLSTASSAEVRSQVRLPLLPAGGDSALVGAMGVLEVEGPCLYLRAADGSRTLPLFARDGVRWSSGSLVVGDRTFRPGQSVTLGGTPADSLPANVAWVQTPDPRCTAPRFFITHQVH
jgi:hypothetical protein